MLDTTGNVNEIKPDPRELYRSQVIKQSVGVLAKFAGPGGLVDLDVAIGHFIHLATDDVPIAKARCSDPAVRDFIFGYVRNFLESDLFVARSRVSMLQHILAQTGIGVQQPSLIERALAQSGGDRHAKQLQSVCNSADHHAVRLQLIRAFTNEAIVRALSGHMVVEGPT